MEKPDLDRFADSSLEKYFLKCKLATMTEISDLFVANRSGADDSIVSFFDKE